MGIQYICSSHYACLVGMIALPNGSWQVCILLSLSLSQYSLSLMRTKVSPSTSMSPTTRIHLLEAVVMLKSSLGVCMSPQSTSGSSLLDLHWCLSAIPSVMWCPMQFSQRFLDQHLKWVTPPLAHSYAERHCLPFSNPHTYVHTNSVLGTHSAIILATCPNHLNLLFLTTVFTFRFMLWIIFLSFSASPHCSLNVYGFGVSSCL